MSDAPSHTLPASANTPTERHAARLTVACHARDPSDLTQLLDTLGLDDHDDEEETT
ncbi:MAG: hypothetical protein ACRDQA_10320 [Nocardioidaceae bacterium]